MNGHQGSSLGQSNISVNGGRQPPIYIFIFPNHPELHSSQPQWCIKAVEIFRELGLCLFAACVECKKVV